MRHLLCVVPLLASFHLAGCSGGSGSAGSGTDTAGAVLVVVDTATGSDALVQFQVEAAVLEAADGATTDNLLANPHMVRLADPSGEIDGLVLRDVPSGDFTHLHLFVVPSSGAALQPDGGVLAASTAVDLVVPITDGLQHTSLGTSCLVIGHNGTAPTVGSTATWVPQMSARSDGAMVDLGPLAVAAVEAPMVTARCAALDDSLLRLEFAAGCTFHDEAGAVLDRDGFVGDLRDDGLRVRASVRRDGRCSVSRAERGRRDDNPRLIGRITAVEPARVSFVMDVQAQNGAGDWQLLTVPTTVRIDASTAQLRRPNRSPLAFGDLQVGHLVKVRWTSRSTPAGELPLLVAREVEVTDAAVGMQPEWQGSVQAVDTVAGTITVVPRHDDPIFVQGVAVASATLSVGAGTVIERRARHGGDRTTIGLDDIVPGSDRIWWRGTVTGARSFDAGYVRVREE